MKKIFLCLAALSMALFTQAKIGYVMFTVNPGGCSNLECYVPWDQDDESPERQAVSWFYDHYVNPSRSAENNYGEGKFLTLGSYTPASGTVSFSTANIADVDVLWINLDRAGSFDALVALLTQGDFETIVGDFVKAGGNVLLTKQAARLVAETGRYTATWPTLFGDAYASNETSNYAVQEWYAGSHRVYNTLLNSTSMLALSTNSKSANRCSFWTMDDDDARNAFQNTYKAKVIGIEGDPANKSGLVEFYPQGDYLGTMLVMGLNSYDWGDGNTLKANVQKLTQNMLDYLSVKPTDASVNWQGWETAASGYIGGSLAAATAPTAGDHIALISVAPYTSSDANVASVNASTGAIDYNYFGSATITSTVKVKGDGQWIPKNAAEVSKAKSVTVSGGNASATIGYVLTSGQHLNLANESGDIPNPDKVAAQWFHTNYVATNQGQFINPANDIPAAVKVLWIHSDRKDLGSESYMTELGGGTFVGKLRTYLAAGKNLFVSKQATRLIGDLQRLGKNGDDVVYPTYGASSGGADSWDYGTHGPFVVGNNFTSSVSVDHSTHAIYKNLGANPTLITATTHTNRNYVLNINSWAGLSSLADFNTYQTTHNCRLLGDWGNYPSKYECGGLVEFYPKDGVGEGGNAFDQKGTIMMLGLAAYQWVNPTDNIRTLTSNILSYLSITEVPTFNWVVEPQNDMVGNTQRVQIEFKNTNLNWTSSNSSIVDIEIDPDYSSDSDYKILRFKAPGEVTITATRSADGYNIPMNVTATTSVTKTINVVTNIYTRDVSAYPTYYGTICLPRAAASYEGATMFRLADKTADNGIVIEEVTEMAAGVPYIFLPTAGEVRVTMTGNTADVQPANGLMGRLTALTLDPDDNHYILAYNKIWQVDDAIEVPANRAYIDMSAINAIAPAPGRKRYVITGTNTTTALEQMEVNNLQNAKVLRNGTLYIIKNGVQYNAQGQMVH